MRALDARWVPRAARALRGVLAAGRSLDVRAARVGEGARRALAPQVLAAVVALVLVAGAASALEARDDPSRGAVAPRAVSLGPPVTTSVETWRTAVSAELAARAQAAPTERALALVVPRAAWTAEQAAAALPVRAGVEPLTAVVREPGRASRELGVRVLPADLVEQVPGVCACTVAVLVGAPLGELAALAGRTDVLAVQPAPRGTTEPSDLFLRTSTLP